ncbi:ABC transporter substrate-binding protein [Streptomyces sp. OF3]|uniref:ABC transporter substrate-binding protein n=1 Tax=Streptomyces alkaliterrae TaxID=2213162 RepID=A0A5P0YQS6_9ACTN|nr:ABC transporter substrate-binding protein [Streptomyces alkaliterrae]MBB1258054.1 ABC transporter substrate-binding protein [Streptomyces alkaliterrae]MQS02615.1 ABC transporter substrate-binding protein [Streptomyces alkaliterrae]
MPTYPRAAALLVVPALLLAACADGGSTATDKARAAGGASGDCITDFRPDEDYFPVKTEVRHAENFTLRYEKSYQVLTVKEPYPKGRPESYVLVRCGAPKPDLKGALADAPQITTPISSLFSASTTHLPLLTETDTLGVLSGVANAAFVSSAEVRDRVRDGKVVEYARDRSIDAEKVIAAKPDVLMTQGTDDPQYPKLRQAGIAVVANAEWLEPTPLGRAEWVKAMAALTGAEKRADEVFDRIENDYRAVAAKAAKAGKPVKVLPGGMYQGTWNMASGGSYMGRLIKDAGGTYPWAGDKGTGNLQLSFEAVYAKGGDAPVWLVGEQWKSLTEAAKADRRYTRLDAVESGEVWTNTKAQRPGGGNDFYERGVLRPDLVLADLFAILHPERAKDHSFTFYARIPNP